MTIEDSVPMSDQLRNAREYHIDLHHWFGPAYLEYPDDFMRPDLGIPQVGKNSGVELFEISGLLDRVMEIIPPITCEQNQEILLIFLEGFMANGNPVTTPAEIYATSKHIDTCDNPDCIDLNNISIRDNILLPNEMRELYGEIIEKHKKRNEAKKQDPTNLEQ